MQQRLQDKSSLQWAELLTEDLMEEPGLCGRTGRDGGGCTHHVAQDDWTILVNDSHKITDNQKNPSVQILVTQC